MILNNTQVVDQSQAIERIPHKPGLIGSLNLYRDVPVSTDAVTFDVRDNSFHILDDHLRNVGEKNTTQDRPYDVHTMAIPHYPIERTIGREKLNGIRAYDSQAEQAVAAALAEELEMQAELHDIHSEYLQALMTVQGVIDTNFYGQISMANEFNVTRPTQVLTDADNEMIAGIREAQRKSKAGLNNGGRVQGYVVLAGVDMFEYLISSGDLKAAYQYSQSSMNPLRNELGEVANGYSLFRWGNVDVVLYDDTFQDKAGNTIEILGSESGVLIPRTNHGRIFYGPSSKLSGLGKQGAKRFAASYRDPKDRFIEVESEQNSLVISEQFGATVELSMPAA